MMEAPIPWLPSKERRCSKRSLICLIAGRRSPSNICPLHSPKRTTEKLDLEIGWRFPLAKHLEDSLLTIHKFCSMLPAFVFQVQPVVRVEDAVRGELEVIAWRDSLKGK